MSTPMRPPMIGGQPLSPVHWSRENGVHADIGLGQDKIHVPFTGQTTLDTFRSGRTFREGSLNDRRLADLGGTFRG